MVSFLIQKSSDQSSFAAPRRLSQRNTSFIASYRQGIHQMLLTYYFFTRTMPELFQRTEQNTLYRKPEARSLKSEESDFRFLFSDFRFILINPVHQLIKIMSSGELALGLITQAVRAFSRYRQHIMMSEKPIHNFKPQKISRIASFHLQIHSSTCEGMRRIPPCF